jgi:protein gp37
MNPCKKSIGWADYTWNIINGCKFGCDYCAARRANQRWGFIPVWENPVFFNYRLIEPYQVTKPSIIFVVFMGDLFGDWISADWIKQVLYITEHNPQHTFMFLTKNPKRYKEFMFPDNCMLGCTITGGEGLERQSFLFNTMKQLKVKGARTFVSIEPIFSSFEGISFAMFDKVIIGAQTGASPVKPERYWIDSIIHSNIYYKNNIIKYFPNLKNKIS